MMIVFLITLFLLVFLLTLFFHIKYGELRWNWDEIDCSKISFPKSFMWGTATAAHQVEGNCENNWSEFEKGSKSDGSPNIKDSQISGLACDHWNRYKEDIKLITKLGVKHYRFSLEWSKIEPEMGKYNQDSINHYSNLIDTLLENNIKPVITLHHFAHPIWFDKLGAFKKTENISHVISFSKKVFEEYSDRVEYWCTINEPGVVAVQGYFTGMFPPGLKDGGMTANVFKNLLESHIQIYNAIKNHRNGFKVKVGIVKNINQFDPWRRYNLLDWLWTICLNHIFNWSTINFFKTGKLKFRIPGLMWLTHKNLDATKSLDFFGLNYYSHNHIKFNLFKKDYSELKYNKKDIMTDMPYTIYAEGIYRAIQLVSSLGVPILITENGVADKGDKVRSEYITKYLYAISRAIDEGYNVIGYYYWSLMDNFEWAFGYDMKFGLYSIDFNNQKRSLKKSSMKFIDIVNNEKE